MTFHSRRHPHETEKVLDNQKIAGGDQFWWGFPAVCFAAALYCQSFSHFPIDYLGSTPVCFLERLLGWKAIDILLF
jgi:hypothetical protein